MAFFTKKPVMIEAIQYTGKTMSTAEVPQWLLDAILDRVVRPAIDEDAKELRISTLEGVMTVSLNDWIIRGVKGEIYPCKPDIFALTYDSEANAPKTLTGLPVAGYKPQDEAKVALVNEFKADEERLLRKTEFFPFAMDEIDARWLAVARTHFQQGFMALNRAVFQPGRVRLPEDDEPQIGDMPATSKTVAQEAVETLKGA